MKWFRFYNDVVDDPKLMTLPLDAYRLWTQCLCVASHSEPRGTLPDLASLAFRVRSDPATLRPMIDTLIERKLITVSAKGNMSIYKWDYYQRPSDNAAARKRKQRNRASPPPTATLPLSRDEPANPETERVEKLCNDLFPCTGWTAHIASACDLYPPAWVEEALQIARDQNANQWTYIRGILQNFRKNGGSESELRARRASAVPRASSMEGQMARDREAAKRLKAKALAEEKGHAESR